MSSSVQAPATDARIIFFNIMLHIEKMQIGKGMK